MDQAYSSIDRLGEEEVDDDPIEAKGPNSASPGPRRRAWIWYSNVTAVRAHEQFRGRGRRLRVVGSFTAVWAKDSL